MHSAYLRFFPSRTIKRTITAYRSKSSYLESFCENRKLLRPFIKHVHPDVFALESEAIRFTNMQCIQNLNELWDSIENISSSSGGNTVDIRNPLRKEYNLSFHVKMKSGNEAGSVVSPKYKATVQIPLALRQRQAIGSKAFEADMNVVLLEQGKLFHLIGIENPWFTEPVKKNNPTYSDDSSGHMTNALHLRLFERFAAASQRHLRYENEEHVSLASIFSEQKGISRKKKGPRDKGLQAFEVDLFIKNGNVLVKNLSVAEEFAAMGLLRQFLIEFGELLNFRTDRWFAVIFVIESTTDLDRYSTSKKAPALSYEKKDSFHIVKISPKFKPRALLEHLRVYIPFTKMDLD
jgi:hypothetical protein